MKTFYSELLKPLKEFAEGEISIQKVRNALSIINRYFYTSSPDIGELHLRGLGFTTQYFSEFHKLWSTSAEEIIAPCIDDRKCKKAAEVLHAIRSTYGNTPFESRTNLHNLRPQALAQIRFLTANQDFRGSRDTEKFFQLYIENPLLFDLTNISNTPPDFLKGIGITKLSQNDKREKFAKTAADFLLEKGISAVDLSNFFNNDTALLKQALTTKTGMGYGNKKADMFIRDMYVWNVWPDINNVYVLDVPSDINTTKVALRSGILKTELTPLLSSFLDIFCYQYSVIDEWTARAWRRVWEFWKSEFSDTAPFGPVFMDHFLYNIIGRDFCKENLYEYIGEPCKHSFYWHSGSSKYCIECCEVYRNSSVSYQEVGGKIIAKCAKHPDHSYEVENRRKKRCQICEETQLNRAKVVDRYLPCTHECGYLRIAQSQYVHPDDAPLSGIQNCPFVPVCSPKSDDFRRLNPPKSISILGRTGWESARTTTLGGGGGLMS